MMKVQKLERNEMSRFASQAFFFALGRFGTPHLDFCLISLELSQSLEPLA